VEDGNIIQEAPLPVWANLRQRALDTAMTEITKKTDISIEIESLERSLHRRVTSLTFVIKAQALPDGDSKSKK
jgi:plasmid replication initiation protein